MEEKLSEGDVVILIIDGPTDGILVGAEDEIVLGELERLCIEGVELGKNEDETVGDDVGNSDG